MYDLSLAVGRVGSDPEIRETRSGTMVANFSVATNRYVPSKDGDGYDEVTEWHRVVAWGDLANRVAQMAQKGTLVLVVGNKQESTYEDRDGNQRKSFKIRARKVEFLADKKGRPENDFVEEGAEGDADDGLPW